MSLKQESLSHIHMPPEIARDVHSFVEHLKQELKDSLLAVVAYGSSVTGEYIHWKTSVNLLIVLKSVDHATLNAAAQVGSRWLRRFPLDPLIMTAQDLLHARNLFPTEFVAMHHRHRMLFGESDPLADIEIDGNALYWDIRHSLHEVLSRLRSHYLRVANNGRELTQLMTDSIEPFLEVITCLLFLQGKHPPARVQQLCTQIRFEFDMDEEALMALTEVRRGKRSLGRGEPHSLFERYLSCVEHMAERVEKMHFTSGMNA